MILTDTGPISALLDADDSHHERHQKSMVRVTLDPKNPSKGMTDWQRVNAMTEEEITESAMSDPDAQPVTEEELKHFRPAPNIKAIRQKLKWS